MEKNSLPAEQESKNGKISLRGAVFIGIGSMVGAGIFALFGEAGTIAGAAVWISFLIAGIIALLQGYSFAKLGARYPSAGGMIDWIVRGYGKGFFTGGIVMLGYFSVLIVTAMVAVSFGNYATSLFLGESADPVWVKALCGCHCHPSDFSEFDWGRGGHQGTNGNCLYRPGGLKRICHCHADEHGCILISSCLVPSYVLYPGQCFPNLLCLPGFWCNLIFRWRYRESKS